ncbi:DUF6268 family outer membrane beta-barrel protein [Winogradskyella sp.]|uniref:DUF6268 family outer membrane beta-barrel protein n=1 Tax=Winogradskyella sp. TaxID=1883156 RepID=UPI0026214911|nr:DUF6268 family outer membrane beta-barrel protein [Winogradskyella sp.]
MKTNLCISAAVLFFFKSAISQQLINPKGGFDLANVSYLVIPSLGDVQLDRQGINLNMFKKLNKGILSLGLGYHRNELTFKDNNESIQFEDFDNFHNIRLNMIYIRPLSKDWSLNVALSPSLLSNFEGDLTTEDIVFNSFTTVGKKWTKENKNSSFRFGLAFGTQFGAPRLFPIASYQKEVNDQLSYSIGLPVTGVFYKINTYNSVQFSLRPEGTFVNNSSTFRIEGNDQDLRNTKLQINAFNLSLGYELTLDDNWVTTFNLGYIPVSNMQVLDDNNDEIYDFEADESISINIGLSFNINKKKKQ